MRGNKVVRRDAAFAGVFVVNLFVCMIRTARQVFSVTVSSRGDIAGVSVVYGIMVGGRVLRPVGSLEDLTAVCRHRDNGLDKCARTISEDTLATQMMLDDRALWTAVRALRTPLKPCRMLVALRWGGKIFHYDSSDRQRCIGEAEGEHTSCIVTVGVQKICIVV